jgi:hypothetical protein
MKLKKTMFMHQRVEEMLTGVSFLDERSNNQRHLSKDKNFLEFEEI